jgi:excisionase family DNA binding protein
MDETPDVYFRNTHVDARHTTRRHNVVVPNIEIWGGKAMGKETTKAATYSVPEAGRLLGLGRSSAYAAARRREIPVLEFGRLLRVPKAALDRMLERAEPTKRERI